MQADIAMGAGVVDGRVQVPADQPAQCFRVCAPDLAAGRGVGNTTVYVEADEPTVQAALSVA